MSALLKPGLEQRAVSQRDVSWEAVKAGRKVSAVQMNRGARFAKAAVLLYRRQIVFVAHDRAYKSVMVGISPPERRPEREIPGLARWQIAVAIAPDLGGGQLRMELDLTHLDRKSVV